ncbi:MAG: hypothetical protein R3E39_07325 [Anaerolineae bacterium]
MLNLQTAQRSRILLRLDGGGGQDADVNWLLERDYCLLVKMFSGNRARQLAQEVAEFDWIPDPQRSDRDVAWLSQSMPNARPTPPSGRPHSPLAPFLLWRSHHQCP